MGQRPDIWMVCNIAHQAERSSGRWQQGQMSHKLGPQLGQFLFEMRPSLSRLIVVWGFFLWVWLNISPHHPVVYLSSSVALALFYFCIVSNSIHHHQLHIVRLWGWLNFDCISSLHSVSLYLWVQIHIWHYILADYSSSVSPFFGPFSMIHKVCLHFPTIPCSGVIWSTLSPHWVVPLASTDPSS